MRKILITGGTVFVSRFVAKYFVKQGDEVFVLNRNSHKQSKYQWYIKNPDEVRKKPYLDFIDENFK